MQQITTELLLQVAMGVHNNAITSQETHSQAFVVFFIAVRMWLYMFSRKPCSYLAGTM